MAKATKRARKQTKADAAAPRRARNTGATPQAKVGTQSGRRSATKVMGLTIPKELTIALDSLVNSQRGRELLASALVAAAGAAAAALVKSSEQSDKRRDRPASELPGEPATNDLAFAAAGALAEMATRAVTGGKTGRRA
jgi:hypothetical protein